MRKRPLLTLMACVFLFHLANAAMLPLIGSAVATRSSQWATALVAACVVVPQLIVAMISPRIGKLAHSCGRRPLLLTGYTALTVRGLLLAWTNQPPSIVAVQMLDGISAATFAVMVPLMLADIMRGTGRLNLAQGMMGVVVGVGATLSTIAAGYLADRLGTSMAFLALGMIGGCGLLLVLSAMPEATPRPNGEKLRSSSARCGQAAAFRAVSSDVSAAR